MNRLQNYMPNCNGLLRWIGAFAIVMSFLGHDVSAQAPPPTIKGAVVDPVDPDNSENAEGPANDQAALDALADALSQLLAWCWNYYWYVPDCDECCKASNSGTNGGSCSGGTCSIKNGANHETWAGPNNNFAGGFPDHKGINGFGGGGGGGGNNISLPPAQAGDPSGPNNQVVQTGSVVEPLRSTYMHWADDYLPSANSHLNVRRYHQTRATYLDSSIGRGSFLNFDLRLAFASDNFGNNLSQEAEITDPSSFGKVRFRDGPNSTSSSMASWDENRCKGLFFFDDQMSPHNYSGAASLSTAKYARLDLWDGGFYLLELISIDNPNALSSTSVGATPTHGRLIEAKNSVGFGYDIAYKTFTSAELTASPARLWQIDTVTDHLSNSLSMTYHTTQVGGQWAIDTITLPDSSVLSYVYNGAFLSEVKLGGTTKATFTYGLTTYANLRCTIVDLLADPGHRRKTVYTTGGATVSGGVVTPTAVGVTQLVANGALELTYVAFDGEELNRTVYEGGGKMKKIDGNDNYRNEYYKNGWKYENGQLTGTLESTSAVKIDNSQYPQLAVAQHLGTPDESYDETGIHREYIYDAEGNALFIEYDDGTFEAFCYTNDQQVKRYRDRLGQVTLTTYDSQGRVEKVEVGLVDSSSNTPTVDPYGGGIIYDRCATDDVQTAEYAKTEWQYYGTGVNGAGLVSKRIDQRGKVTDYEYDANHRLFKIIEPAVSSGGTRPEIERTYYSNGLLKTVTDPMDNVTEYFYSGNKLISTLYDDGTTEQILYATSGNAEGLVEKTIDRNGTVNKYEYDSADRLLKKITAYARMDGSTEVLTPEIASEETWTYVNGTKQPDEHRRNGALTKFIYDYRGRLAQTHTHPDSANELIAQRVYVDNKVFYSSDPFERKTYVAYDATDGRTIRTVTGTTPEFSLTNFAAVVNQARDLTPNADFIVSDSIYFANGNLDKTHDGRNVQTHHGYDSRNRQIWRLAAATTNVEARTETDYNEASNVEEVRSPRYFDSSDTDGYQKAKENWTYNDRGLVDTHTEAAGTSVAATESFTYDLNDRRDTHTDFEGKIWTTHYEDCCGYVTASENPLGHGSITRKNSVGQTVHQVSIADYTSHVTALDNPVDAKTYREATTLYDNRGRPLARTTWLVARGVVDVDDPPIAGLGGVSAADGLTEQYLYDDDLNDGSGLDSSTGVTPLIGSTAVSLSTAITKLADTEANGGAGISFSADAPGSARVSINPEGEVRFSIANGTGQSVMSGILKPSDNSLITWNCSKSGETATISGYGTVLVSKSINALGKIRKSLSDGAGRTIESHDGLSKITAYTYDASGNQLSVRDPNSVGQDCIYDELGRDKSCTDTASVTTSSTYDAAGNKITAKDAKNEVTTYKFDARGRQYKQIDRLSGETIFAYKKTGQLESLTDAESQVTSYTYDDAGTKLTETYPDHTASTNPGDAGYGIVTFTPDPTGRTLRKQDQLGDTVTYNHDLAGRLTSREYRTKVNSPSGTIADTDSFTYDDASRMLTAVSGRYSNTVTYTYDDAGRKETEALTIAGQTYTTTTGYNLAGQVDDLLYPDGTVVDRTYTDRGQLHEIKRDTVTIDTRTYDNGGRMLTSSYNNGVSETRGYNNDNTLSSISYSGAAIGNLSYGWDSNKNKTSEGVTGTMSGYGFSVGASGYDDEDRLRNWERADNNLDQSWNLTAVGDWDSFTENASVQNRTHGAAHEILTAATEAITHDAKGNMTSIPAVLRPGSDPLALSWDFDNRVTGADVDNDSTDDVTYQYDALGRRVLRDDGTTATVFIQSGQQTIADYTSGTAATSPDYTYVYASYIDEPIYRGGTGGARYYHRNQQYSVVALTDSSGNIKERYAYSAYGVPVFLDGSGTVLSSSAENNRYTYTGREWDDVAELFHYRARIYLPRLGRFGARDPIGYAGSQWNYYEYVNGQAPRVVDPYGMHPILVLLVRECAKRAVVPVAKQCAKKGAKVCRWVWKTVKTKPPLVPPFGGQKPDAQPQPQPKPVPISPPRPKPYPFPYPMPDPDNNFPPPPPIEPGYDACDFYYQWCRFGTDPNTVKGHIWTTLPLEPRDCERCWADCKVSGGVWPSECLPDGHESGPNPQPDGGNVWPDPPMYLHPWENPFEPNQQFFSE